MSDSNHNSGRYEFEFWSAVVNPYGVAFRVNPALTVPPGWSRVLWSSRFMSAQRIITRADFKRHVADGKDPETENSPWRKPVEVKYVDAVLRERVEAMEKDLKKAKRRGTWACKQVRDLAHGLRLLGVEVEKMRNERRALGYENANKLENLDSKCKQNWTGHQALAAKIESLELALSVSKWHGDA